MALGDLAWPERILASLRVGLVLLFSSSASKAPISVHYAYSHIHYPPKKIKARVPLVHCSHEHIKPHCTEKWCHQYASVPPVQCASVPGGPSFVTETGMQPAQSHHQDSGTTYFQTLCNLIPWIWNILEWRVIMGPPQERRNKWHMRLFDSHPRHLNHDRVQFIGKDTADLSKLKHLLALENGILRQRYTEKIWSSDPLVNLAKPRAQCTPALPSGFL